MLHGITAKSRGVEHPKTFSLSTTLVSFQTSLSYQSDANSSIFSRVHSLAIPPIVVPVQSPRSLYPYDRDQSSHPPIPQYTPSYLPVTAPKRGCERLGCPRSSLTARTLSLIKIDPEQSLCQSRMSFLNICTRSSDPLVFCSAPGRRGREPRSVFYPSRPSQYRQSLGENLVSFLFSPSCNKV